jgi:outer membrane receptor protein involved in Fe transport
MPARPGWCAATAGIAILPTVVLAQVSGPAESQLPPIVVEGKQAPAKKQTPQVPQKRIAPSALPQAASDEPAASLSISPGGGGEIPLTKVPGLAVVLPQQDIERDSPVVPTSVLQQRVPGIIINDVLGNALGNDAQLRGFSASPLNGTAQGLAVYQNSVRINEVFGDTVNWDLVPMVAVDSIAVLTNNPLFGLNALGGAVVLQMKNGFMFQGIETDTRIGSFGRKVASVQGGIQAGGMAGYAAAETLDDGGWRDFSPAKARRFYADIGVKDSGSEVHLSFSKAGNFLGVVGPTPVELLTERRENVFTTPQSLSNQMTMVNLNGTVALSNTLKLTGLVYWRGFRQRRPDGNISEISACDSGGPNSGLLCTEENGVEQLVESASGGTIPESVLGGGIPGSLDRTAVEARAIGGSLQAVSKAKVFGLGNQLTVGASFDQGRATVASSSELGVVDPNALIVSGLGITLGGDEFSPVSLKVRTDYYGLYFSNTLDLTSRLSLTLGARYNLAKIELADQLGDDLNGSHQFGRFNPMAGATFNLLPGIWLYGGYSEATRAPTPAELACADPLRPCLLENFLVSDPPLKQVVSHTVETGIKGQTRLGRNAHARAPAGRLEWSLGLFRTLSTDDILSVASDIQGRGYFVNAGDTLRQGVEASLTYRSAKLLLYANYAFVDATFRSALKLSSPNNPAADANGDVQVQPGDRIPSIPPHRLKAGFDYLLTPEWKFGMDVVALTGQFLRGDEGNDSTQLAGYAVVNLHSSYQLTKNVQIYGLVENLFDKKFATFGTLFDVEPLAAARGLTDPRMVTPAPPLAAYGGVKIEF